MISPIGYVLTEYIKDESIINSLIYDRKRGKFYINFPTMNYKRIVNMVKKKKKTLIYNHYTQSLRIIYAGKFESIILQLKKYVAVAKIW